MDLNIFQHLCTGSLKTGSLGTGSPGHWVLFLSPLKSRGKPFLGLAQLSKIFLVLFFSLAKVTKIPEGVAVGFRNFAWAPN